MTQTPDHHSPACNSTALQLRLKGPPSVPSVPGVPSGDSLFGRMQLDSSRSTAALHRRKSAKLFTGRFRRIARPICVLSGRDSLVSVRPATTSNVYQSALPCTCKPC